MHTGMINITNKSKVKSIFSSIIKFMQEINHKHGLTLVAYNPNLCQGKYLDRQKLYYPYHDLLFVKKVLNDK